MPTGTSRLADQLTQETDPASFTGLPAPLVIALGIGLLILVVALLIAALTVWRRIRRSGTWRRGILAARAQLERGARREVLDLRLALENALVATGDAAEVAARTTAPTGELPGLAGRLQSIGDRLRGQLDLLAGERSDDVLDAMLPTLRRRVQELVAAGGQIRRGLLLAMDGTGGDVAEVARAADDQVRALQAALDELRDLSAPATPGRIDARRP